MEISPEEFQRVKDELKSAQHKIDKLESDNYGYRSRLRELRQELADAQKSVPPEGAVVLTGDKADMWQAFVELGDPKGVAKQLEELDAIKKEMSTLKRAEELRSVAQVAGYEYDVLQALASDTQFAIIDGENGEKVVTVKLAGGSTISLEDFAKQHWQAFLPALMPSMGRNNANGGNGKRIPPQPGGDNKRQKDSGGNNILDAYLKEKRESAVPSPFIKKE